jgi:NAD(P)-dependent dehydrogenase (short-subunit alcohol dehydrogenase family)
MEEPLTRENTHAQDTWARDRVAVITGGASGIGLAITEQLVALGARVAVWDIRTDRLEALQARFGYRVMVRRRCHLNLNSDARETRCLGD